MRLPFQLGWKISANIALAPGFLVLAVVYLGSSAWTVWISLTNSRMLPNSNFVGLRQYETLFANDRWLTSVSNLVIFGVLFVGVTLILGFLLAVFIDQRVRGEDTFRAIFLYPYSMSFVVTGLIWQWLLNPTLGIEKMLHDWGFTGAKFDWIVRQDMVIYCLVFAAVWHGAGVVMAIMLAGLRGIDEDIWKATKIDGIKPWRAYLFIVIPMMGASIATASVLLVTSVVRVYDLSVAMTNGGPGIASEVPAKFVMDFMFERANLGLATAAATSMLFTVAAVVGPYVYWQSRRNARSTR
jgi:glucose/mannose transport system permease protein